MLVKTTDGTPDAVKVARPVWSGGKSGDNFKGLPIRLKRLSRTLFFEMSERCNNSACFSVEIKGTSDICVTFVVYDDYKSKITFT